jgi:hypothetical protein
MSEIYIEYSRKTGFRRIQDKTGLTGTVVGYAEFKNLSAGIASDSPDSYGIILKPEDIRDFIANYEADSLFTDAEKK